MIKYKSGGNYYLLFQVIKDNSLNGVCSLTQGEIALKIRKTRQFVSKGLNILKENGLVEFSYKEIKVLHE